MRRSRIARTRVDYLDGLRYGIMSDWMLGHTTGAGAAVAMDILATAHKRLLFHTQ